MQRLKELVEGKEGQHLRLTVEAGGCSGFSYKFDLDDGHQEGDRYAMLLLSANQRVKSDS